MPVAALDGQGHERYMRRLGGCYRFALSRPRRLEPGTGGLRNRCSVSTSKSERKRMLALIFMEIRADRIDGKQLSVTFKPWPH